MNDFFVLLQLISCDQSDLDEGFSDAMCYISITCLYYIVPFFLTEWEVIIIIIKLTTELPCRTYA
jgi:hypothetical protein